MSSKPALGSITGVNKQIKVNKRGELGCSSVVSACLVCARCGFVQQHRK
jgi:hypothetical protein